MSFVLKTNCDYFLYRIKTKTQCINWLRVRFNWHKVDIICRLLFIYGSFCHSAIKVDPYCLVCSMFSLSITQIFYFVILLLHRYRKPTYIKKYIVTKERWNINYEMASINLLLPDPVDQSHSNMAVHYIAILLIRCHVMPCKGIFCNSKFSDAWLKKQQIFPANMFDTKLAKHYLRFLTV